MIGSPVSLSNQPAAPGEQTQAIRRSGRTTRSGSSRNKREADKAAGGGGEKRPRPDEPLQTPPRLTAAREEAEEGRIGRPQLKPMYFLGELVPEEEMVVEVNAGGMRFNLPRAALGPLMRWVAPWKLIPLFPCTLIV